MHIFATFLKPNSSFFLNGYCVLADYCGANSHAVHPVPFTPGANSHLDDRKEQRSTEMVQKMKEEIQRRKPNLG